MLQLLTYYTTGDEEEEASHRYAEESCWHARPGSAIIHTQVTAHDT